ncbi:VWA domain-containing protein [Myxococcota bacterium]|jgi:Ca-activated chloride channel family protein|nr:VWA domain-containing protein [Myxococcota bacterium]MBU1413682.1 VWA domain-containing protein [Myxococcota bacterium]MBU1509459.1 VWA domain-containing protein [Myxococcota bacterium]
MRRRDQIALKKGPISGLAEEVGVPQKHGLGAVRESLWPWILWTVVMAVVAWGIAASLQRFHRPVELGSRWVLWFLLVLPVLAFYAFRFHSRRQSTWGFSRLALLASIPPGIRTYFITLPFSLRCGAFALLIFAAAQPRLVNVFERSEDEGIDIVLVMDVSLSMEANDLEPNRFVAARNVMSDFVKQRPKDRIGFVIFGRDAYPYCPLTRDHHAIQRLLGKLRLRQIDDGQATAIGEALGTALNMLSSSKGKSKVVILLTDGANNSGEMAPRESAEHAAALGVRVHTVLVGSPSGEGGGLFGLRAPTDPELLEHIAARTGGMAFIATDKKALENRFQRILDLMEKNKFEHRIRTTSGVQDRFLAAAVLLFFLEMLLSLTWLRRLP